MRETMDFSRDWLFYLGEAAVGEQVCLPHTVQLTPANSCGGRNYQGLCRYENTLSVDAARKGQKVFLELEGAMGKSALYVNGTLVKEHFCGYIPFVADITEFVTFGGADRILVELDNSDCEEYPPGKNQGDLDFTYEGGLYRKAKVTFTGPVYVTDPLLAEEIAGGGVFAHYENISDAAATLKVKTQVKNETAAAAAFTLVQRLVDESGAVVCETAADHMLQAGAAQHFEDAATVEAPTLWDIHKPYLYMLETEIRQGDTVLDRVTTETGIRSFTFTENDGTIFNGKSRRIIGTNYHQTYPYLGNGVPLSLMQRDMLKLKDVGMENIRSHYPFSQALVSFLNRIGMTLIVSNVGWQFCKEGIFFERTCHNMRQIIRWQRNNPCVLMWEPILNESKIDLEHQTILADIVHEEYPYEGCFSASDFGPTDVAYREFDPGMLGKGMEEYGLVKVEDGKVRPRWVREYGDCPDNFVDQNSAWRTPRSFGDFAMGLAVERMIGRFDAQGSGTYTAVYNNPKNCGYGVWPGIEHNRGYHINPCWGGYFDLFRVQKFTGAFIKSQQDRSVIGDYIFIANYWSEVSPGDVTVYSNADAVRLCHDDTLVAEQTPDDAAVKHPPFTFKDVRRRFKQNAKSTLRAEAIVNGKVVAETSVSSPGVPKLLQLEADHMGIPLKADGADVVMVYCKVTDIDGNVVPQAADTHPIRFKVEGAGTIVGDDAIGANPVFPEGGIAAILVKAGTTPGEIKITATPHWPQPNRNYIQFGGDEIGIRSAELVIKSE